MLFLLVADASFGDVFVMILTAGHYHLANSAPKSIGFCVCCSVHLLLELLVFDYKWIGDEVLFYSVVAVLTHLHRGNIK